MIQLKDAELLIKLARDSIFSNFSGIPVDFSDVEEFSDKQGVFVTLHKYGELRGCIGFPYPTYPLFEAISKAAKSAAFSDPRFPPLVEEELGEIEIEISVLTVPEKIDVKNADEYMDKIEIGKDGLIVKSGMYSGLLLPQVFVEYKSSVEEALRMTCQKAGMPEDSWKNSDVEFFKFQAQIFSEKDGKVVES